VRIGLIVPPWLPVPPPSYGGTEAVVAALARGFDAAGHDVVLFTTGDSTCPVPIDYVYPTAQREQMNSTVPALYHALAGYEALADCDVIHDHTVAGLIVAARLGRTGVVATNHGPFTDELRKIYGAVDRDVAIVAISRDQASRAGDVKITRVIHHGLDIDEFELGPGTGGYLLFLGRMSPDKGVETAARAARVAGRRLLIAAKMTERGERQYFEERIEPLLGDDVVYLGEMDYEAKKVLLANAEALVNPIQWPEPFGLVMLESLASGTPVVSYPRGAAPEIIEDGVTGFMCHDEAGMVEAFARLDRLDRSACRRVFEERFTSQRMVQDHLNLYADVTRPRESSAA
jgi:glycosyltransferase involved in cell wall biosynthesis